MLDSLWPQPEATGSGGDWPDGTPGAVGHYPRAPSEPEYEIVFTTERWQVILLSASVTIPLVSLIVVLVLIFRQGALA
jgi:hypothetical protein